MRTANVKAAVDAARRFLVLAGKLETTGYNKTSLMYVNHGKASGAARRASMDLTRALAEMRKP